MDSRNKWAEIVKECFDMIRKIENSPSHGVFHSKDVLRYALRLNKKYKANKKVIIIAAILHDISRHFGAHGKNQGKQKIELIEKFLEKLLKEKKITANEKNKILNAIIFHSIKDKSQNLNLEEKIISDADSLAGFGIKGIIRIAMYSGERKKEFEYVIKKICIDMKKREENLYFKESKKIAKKLNKKIKKIRKELCSY